MQAMLYSLWKKRLWVKMLDTNEAVLFETPEKAEELRIDYRKFLEDAYPHHFIKLKQEIQAEEG
jgi:hypothetical protein